MIAYNTWLLDACLSHFSLIILRIKFLIRKQDIENNKRKPQPCTHVWCHLPRMVHFWRAPPPLTVSSVWVNILFVLSCVC